MRRVLQRSTLRRALTNPSSHDFHLRALLLTDPGIQSPVLDLDEPTDLSEPSVLARHCVDLIHSGSAGAAAGFLPRLSEVLSVIAEAEEEPDAGTVMSICTAAYLTLSVSGNAEGAHDAALQATGLLGEHPAALHLLAHALALTSDTPAACRVIAALAFEHSVNLDASSRAIATAYSDPTHLDIASAGFGASFGTVVRLSAARLHSIRGDAVASARAVASALALAEDAPVYGSVGANREALGKHWTVTGGLTSQIPTDDLSQWVMDEVHGVGEVGGVLAAGGEKRGGRDDGGDRGATPIGSLSFTDALCSLPPLLRICVGLSTVFALSTDPRKELKAMALLQHLLANGAFGGFASVPTSPSPSASPSTTSSASDTAPAGGLSSPSSSASHPSPSSSSSSPHNYALSLGIGAVPSLVDADVRARELWAPPNEQVELEGLEGTASSSDHASSPTPSSASTSSASESSGENAPSSYTSAEHAHLVARLTIVEGAGEASVSTVLPVDDSGECDRLPSVIAAEGRVPAGFEPVLARDLRWSTAPVAPRRNVTPEVVSASLSAPQTDLVQDADAALGPPRAGVFLTPSAYALHVEPAVPSASLFWAARLQHCALMASIAQGLPAATASRLKALKPPPPGDAVESNHSPSSYIPMKILHADSATPTPDQVERYAAALASVCPPGQRGSFIVPFVLASGRDNAVDAAEVWRPGDVALCGGVVRWYELSCRRALSTVTPTPSIDILTALIRCRLTPEYIDKVRQVVNARAAEVYASAV